jgi:hypothetical protein
MTGPSYGRTRGLMQVMTPDTYLLTFVYISCVAWEGRKMDRLRVMGIDFFFSSAYAFSSPTTMPDSPCLDTR